VKSSRVELPGSSRINKLLDFESVVVLLSSTIGVHLISIQQALGALADFVCLKCVSEFVRHGLITYFGKGSRIISCTKVSNKLFRKLASLPRSDRLTPV